LLLSYGVLDTSRKTPKLITCGLLWDRWAIEWQRRRKDRENDPAHGTTIDNRQPSYYPTLIFPCNIPNAQSSSSGCWLLVVHCTKYHVHTHTRVRAALCSDRPSFVPPWPLLDQLWPLLPLCPMCRRSTRHRFWPWKREKP